VGFLFSFPWSFFLVQKVPKADSHCLRCHSERAAWLDVIFLPFRFQIQMTPLADSLLTLFSSQRFRVRSVCRCFDWARSGLPLLVIIVIASLTNITSASFRFFHRGKSTPARCAYFETPASLQLNLVCPSRLLIEISETFSRPSSRRLFFRFQTCSYLYPSGMRSGALKRFYNPL